MPNLLQYLLILEARQVPRMFQIHLPPFPVLKKPCSYEKMNKRSSKKFKKDFKKLFAFRRFKKIHFGRKFFHKHILNVYVFRKLNKPVLTK